MSGKHDLLLQDERSPTTLPHLFVAVPQSARRPVKGEHSSAAKRRTLTGRDERRLVCVERAQGDAHENA